MNVRFDHGALVAGGRRSANDRIRTAHETTEIVALNTAVVVASRTITAGSALLAGAQCCRRYELI
ncbi:hypothetical protein CV102_07760 [Natronococcus pandeyae]|uniref:Uncharacterized protein n=1 Tax=Natronococcus pandeyae TaxID=2055836 RepID=A0A8J8TSV5_9EURY|nr:hypothetical protein CV102_07760 [Natronococcus pandeyae]